MATQTKFLKLTIADNSEDIRPITNSNMLKIEKSYGGMSNQIGNLTNVVSQNNLINVKADTCIKFIHKDGKYQVEEYKRVNDQWKLSGTYENFFADAENFTGYYFKEEWNGVADAEPPFNMDWSQDDILVINQTTTATGYGVDYRKFPQVLGGYYRPTLSLEESPQIQWNSVPSIHTIHSLTTPLPLFITNGRVQTVKIDRVTPDADESGGWSWQYTILKEEVPKLFNASDTGSIPIKLRVVEASGNQAENSNEVFIKQTWSITENGDYQVVIHSDVPYVKELYAYFDIANPTLIDRENMPRISLTKAILSKPANFVDNQEDPYPLLGNTELEMQISLKVEEGVALPGDEVLISYARRGVQPNSGFRNLYIYKITNDNIYYDPIGVQYIVFPLILHIDGAQNSHLLRRLYYTYNTKGENIKFIRIRRNFASNNSRLLFSNKVSFKWRGTVQKTTADGQTVYNFGLPRIEII